MGGLGRDLSSGQGELRLVVFGLLHEGVNVLIESLSRKFERQVDQLFSHGLVIPVVEPGKRGEMSVLNRTW